MKCQNCGAENLDSKKFCGDCGKPLPQPETVRPTYAANPLTPNVYFFGRKIPPLLATVGILGVCLFMGVAFLSLGTNTSATRTPQLAARSTGAATEVVASQVTETPRATEMPSARLLPTLSSTPTLPPTKTPVPPQVLAKQTVNVRTGPGTQFAVVGKLQTNTSAAILGKNENGQWLQIAFPDAADPGWVSASVVTVNGSTDSIQVVVVEPTPAATRGFDVAAYKKTFKSIDVRDLKKSPEEYMDEKIVLRGEVFTIKENSNGTQLQIWVSYPGASTFDRVAVFVQYLGNLDGLYEKQTAIVYGQGAGTVEGTNALGGVISQPLILAEYVDYGSRLPTAVPPTKAPAIPPTAKNVTANLQGKWEITYVGEFRDKTVFFYDNAKTAFGTWATIQFRIKNIQSGSTSIGSDYSFVAMGQDGKSYDENFGATLYTAWQYCGCDTHVDEIGPGQETVIVMTFDVPETTQTLTFAPTSELFSSTPLAAPRFLISTFNQVPAWKPKK